MALWFGSVWSGLNFLYSCLMLELGGWAVSRALFNFCTGWRHCTHAHSAPRHIIDIKLSFLDNGLLKSYSSASWSLWFPLVDAPTSFSSCKLKIMPKRDLQPVALVKEIDLRQKGQSSSLKKKSSNSKAKFDVLHLMCQMGLELLWKASAPLKPWIETRLSKLGTIPASRGIYSFQSNSTLIIQSI